jgi:ABC-type bacteriocin/lantibiotic exporter with double-glycine peptidase domain
MFRLVARLLLVFVFSGGVLAAGDSRGAWLDVPFIEQEKEGCGSASIAMVMQYWLKQQGQSANDSVNVEEIQRALHVPGNHGINATAMERYFQQNGFRTFSFRGQWEDLQQHLKKGRPLIVALKPPGSGSSLHYVVVAGMDWERELLLLNDPAQRKLLKQERSTFEKQWSATRHWTLLAVPLRTGIG